MVWWTLALGGALGSLCRYVFSSWQPAAGWPWATFLINLSGAYILALFLTLAIEAWALPAAVRLGFGTGFVGAYTTFSTFVWEAWRLHAQGQTWLAVLYVHLSAAGGLLLAYGGHRTAIAWMQRRRG
ncbi:MAG: CrcB family protein [Alicyclobacillaceae bacterium]|nr:CrcB family protein [Alicyclobacillaceae bacterium]